MYKKISLFAGEIVVSDLDIFDEGFMENIAYREQRSWKIIHSIIASTSDFEDAFKSVVYQWNTRCKTTDEKIKRVAYSESQRREQFTIVTPEKEKELIVKISDMISNSKWS